MISKKDYEKAVKTVEQFEKEQEENKLLLDLAKIEFPIDCYVVSKLNTAVRGIVKDYGIWSGAVQLKCERSGKIIRMMARNAVIV